MQVRRSFALIPLSALAAAALILAPPAGAAETSQVTGRVESVNLIRKTLIVKDQAGRLHTVVVGDNSDIAIPGGGKLTLERVQPGATVTVRDTINAASVRVGDEVLGTIR